MDAFDKDATTYRFVERFNHERDGATRRPASCSHLPTGGLDSFPSGSAARWAVSCNALACGLQANLAGRTS